MFLLKITTFEIIIHTLHSKLLVKSFCNMTGCKYNLLSEY